MNDPIVAVVPINKIHVKEGHNPRTEFDADELAGLASSVEATGGLVQPIAVEPIEGKPGQFWIIDGERRWLVLKGAGAKKAPIFVKESENAKLAATAANVVRAKLNPIEEAHGIKAAAILAKAKTNEEIATASGFSVGHVAAAMRLLRLPEVVQPHIAAGYVPLAAEPNLRKASKFSPALAECACRLVRDGEVEGRDLVERFGEVLDRVAQSDMDDKPTMIDVSRPVRLSGIVSNPAKYADLVERCEKITGTEPGSDPLIRFHEEEVDAARAGKVLIEFQKANHYRNSTYTTYYVTDEEWAIDLVVRVIEREESLQKEAEAEADKQRDEADANGGNDEAPDESEREKRTKARKAREKAHDKNLAIGRGLINQRGAKNRKRNKLAWAKAVAGVVLRDNENLAAAGLGLAFEQLQTIDYKHVKVTNETEKKVTYASPEACRNFLANRIEEARTAEEVWELLGEALIAYGMVDPEAVPQSRRVNYWLKSGTEVAKILGEQMKTVRAVARRK